MKKLFINILVICMLVLTSMSVLATSYTSEFERFGPITQKKMLGDVLCKSGKTCSKVTSLFRMGSDRDNAVYWSVMCKNGSSYAIQISTTGSTRILECSVLEMLGMKCFRKLR